MDSLAPLQTFLRRCDAPAFSGWYNASHNNSKEAVMPGPGVYMPDATEGITRVEDLPKPHVIERSRNYPRQCCPKCDRGATRLRTAQRTLHELGDPVRGRPRDLHITYSQ